jgi:multiple sugar transport system substrate-binding protein
MLEARLAAGEAFDIIQMDTTHFPAYAERRYLHPLDYVAGPALDDFFESLVQAFTFEGETYGVPRDSDALVLLYNADRFAEAGLNYPNDDWNWDDLQQYGWAITESTGMAGASAPADPYYFRPTVLQAGGDIMSPDFSDTWIDHGEAIHAGHSYTGARAEGWAIIPEDSGASWYGEAFAWGDVAMTLGGFWMQGYLSGQAPDLVYGAVHVPSGPAGKGTVAFPSGYAVSANSPAPQAAWKAIDCLTSVDAQALMLDSGVALPSRRNFENHPYMADNPLARAVYTSLEFASPHAWGPHHDEIDAQIREALRRVYYEGWSVEDSFAVAADEIRAIITR